MRARTSPARAAAAVVAALVAGLLVFWLTRPQPGDAAMLSAAMRGPSQSAPVPGSGVSARPSAAAPTSAIPTAVLAATPTATPAAPSRPGPPPAAPTRLTIDTVGLQMPVVPVGVAANGEMALPRSPAEAGWYRFGAHPGDPQGATVIAGHLDEPWYGTGPLGRLAEVTPGDAVVVDTGTTSRRFVVTEVQAVRKTRLDLSALFRTDGPPSLHIVTCGGRFDPVQRRYDENVVVVARPA